MHSIWREANGSICFSSQFLTSDACSHILTHLFSFCHFSTLLFRSPEFWRGVLPLLYIGTCFFLLQRIQGADGAFPLSLLATLSWATPRSIWAFIASSTVSQATLGMHYQWSKAKNETCQHISETCECLTDHSQPTTTPDSAPKTRTWFKTKCTYLLKTRDKCLFLNFYWF